MKKLILKTSLFAFLGLTALAARAQKPNWQNLDLKTDSVFGISTEKTYTELLRGKKARTVVVAVIDGGVDTAHEDLRAVLWNNPRKTRQKDSHGWNFIGSAKGNVLYDNLELTRQVRQQQARFAKDSTSDAAAFAVYHQERTEFRQKLAEAQGGLHSLEKFEQVLDGMTRKMGGDTPALADFRAYAPQDDLEQKVKKVLVANLEQKPDFKAFREEEIEAGIRYYREQVDYQLNLAYDPREIVGDDYFNSAQRNYGNNDIMGPDAHHGTHVSGIIAAVRDNNLGIKGVADHVQIMGVRTVPNGDERDKDVANAIRYAADNGAKVINMSFGKPYSQDKKAVDEAVKYALSKDVLLVSAAGNDNKDLDREADFPNRRYADGGEAQAWIVVGASGWKNDTTLKASFSNYGKTTVDVFAPGVKINSTVPGSKYAEYDGTSMATPVVAGLAALIREYYPKLTAPQVKEILLRSVEKVDHAVNLETGGRVIKVPFTDLCITGGIVNAYRAMELAAQQGSI